MRRPGSHSSVGHGETHEAVGPIEDTELSLGLADGQKRESSTGNTAVYDTKLDLACTLLINTDHGTKCHYPRSVVSHVL